MAYNPLSGRKPQLDDFVNVLPVRSKKNLISVKRGYLTHCVGQNHTDKNPSMGLMQGEIHQQKRKDGIYPNPEILPKILGTV